MDCGQMSADASQSDARELARAHVERMRALEQIGDPLQQLADHGAIDDEGGDPDSLAPT